MQFEGYSKTKQDKFLELIFLSISQSLTSPKCLRKTLAQSIESALRVAEYKGIAA
jgi:hypothetical protein